jgi:DNA polymerase III delta prime subunit
MNIVGQDELINHINELIAENHMPRFIIVMGARKSGKKLIAEYIANKLGDCIEVEQSTEAVREAVQTSYRVAVPTVYRLRNIEAMHTNAKNSLLKVTEEPPRQAYFITTATNAKGILDTLKSRAYVVKINPYSKDSLIDYARDLDTTWNLNNEDIMLIGKLCDTPGDVQELLKLDIVKLWNDVGDYLRNIGKTSGVENFKVRQLLKIKDTDKGYDIDLFMSACKKWLYWSVKDKVCESFEHYGKVEKSLEVTTKYLSELDIKSISKNMLADAWIMALREIWK